MAWDGFPDSGRRTRRHSGRDAQKMANRGRHPPAHPTRRICIQPVELILSTQKNVTSELLAEIKPKKGRTVSLDFHLFP